MISDGDILKIIRICSIDNYFDKSSGEFEFKNFYFEMLTKSRKNSMTRKLPIDLRIQYRDQKISYLQKLGINFLNKIIIVVEHQEQK